MSTPYPLPSPPFWKTLTFYTSIFAIVLSIISLYESSFNEGYELDVGERISIFNDINGIVITPFVTIINTGVKPLSINKMEAFLIIDNGSKKEHKLFRSVVTANIPGKSVWSGDINFFVKLEDKQVQVRNKFLRESKNYLITKYRVAKKKDEEQMFLSDKPQSKIDDNEIKEDENFEKLDLYTQARVLLKHNTTDWIIATKDEDKYQLLLMFWINDPNKNGEPSEYKLHSFNLTEDQIKPLTNDQLISWLTPYQEMFKENKFMVYTAIPTTHKIKDKSEINKIYKVRWGE